MKIDFKNLAVVAVAFAMGVGFNNVAISALTANVAVVDVLKVVEASSEVKALKKEQAAKAKEIQDWITTAREDVAKQSKPENKEKLAKKYEADLVKKQQALQKEYAGKLAVIDKNISEKIASEASSKGYTLVLNKASVLYGGVDITKSISALVK